MTGQVRGVGRRLHHVADDGGVGKFWSDSGLCERSDISDGLKLELGQNFMAQKILNLRAYSDVGYRIRKSGKFI